MICNTGIGLIPRVDGQVHTFTEQGLYDGLFLLYDHESGTRWNHMTGEAVHGPRAGDSLELELVLHTTVEQALAEDPDALLAWSDHPSAQGVVEQRGGLLSRLLASIPDVPSVFPGTMGREDARRDRMEMGIGIWSDRAARYYPMDAIRSRGDALLDDFDGDRVLIYYDPTARALQAEITGAERFEWDGRTLRLGNGDYIEGGVLFDASGARKPRTRPLQVFTRWYGFSLTFPETEVYAAPPVS